MASWLIAWVASLVVHEAGHAVAQRICRIPVERVGFGIGPVLFQWKRVEIRLFALLGGYTCPAGPLYTKKRWQGLFISVAGCLAQWIVVFLMILFGIGRIPDLLAFGVDFILLAMMGLFNLLPIGKLDGRFAAYSLGLVSCPIQEREQPRKNSLI